MTVNRIKCAGKTTKNKHFFLASDINQQNCFYYSIISCLVTSFVLKVFSIIFGKIALV